MIQHCVNCDRPMHLRGGDMTTTCAECREKENPSYTALRELQERLPKGVQIGWPEHPLPRSEAHDLDARALRARLDAQCDEIDRMRDRLARYAHVVLAARAYFEGRKKWNTEGYAKHDAVIAALELIYDGE